MLSLEFYNSDGSVSEACAEMELDVLLDFLSKERQTKTEFLY